MTKKEFLKKVNDRFEKIIQVVPEPVIFDLLGDAAARLDKEQLRRAYLAVQGILMEKMPENQFDKTMQDIDQLEKTAAEEFGFNKVSN